MISITCEITFELHVLLCFCEVYDLDWKGENVMVPAGRTERVMFIPGRGVAERRIGGGRRD